MPVLWGPFPRGPLGKLQIAWSKVSNEFGTLHLKLLYTFCSPPLGGRRGSRYSRSCVFIKKHYSLMGKDS